MEFINIYIGKRILKFRKREGLTQKELAKMVNMHRSNIANTESGAALGSLKKLYDFASALNVKVTDLLPSTKWYQKNKPKS